MLDILSLGICWKERIISIEFIFIASKRIYMLRYSSGDREVGDGPLVFPTAATSSSKAFFSFLNSIRSLMMVALSS